MTSRIDMNGWSHLSDEQHTAAKAAARLIEDADLRFVFMLFADDGRGAVLGNVEPSQAVELIEAALAAARANVEVDLIQGEDRLQ